MKIKISHEVPISLLEESKKFNDYDYCLLHLIFENETYLKFYQNSVKEGREVLLDNSLFELGDSLSSEKLVEGINLIHPTSYVVPDALNDCDLTIERFKNFVKKYPNLEGIKIGVVHGKTLDELVKCYKFISVNADKIAIGFGCEGFKDLISKDQDWNDISVRNEGRRKFIEYLVNNGIWNNFKPHHLLGCWLPIEFDCELYKRISIESLDTSNPIVSAIMGMRYDMFGLKSKPSIKLYKLINHTLTEKEKEDALYNVSMFREICER